MLVVAERAVQGRTITIGRAPSNAIVLDDPLVSRHHARLTGGPRQGYRIEDLSGLNGVRINGRPAPGGSVFRDGDRLGIGRTTLVISGGRIVATEPAHTALSADELSFVIKAHGQRKTLLDRVSFRVRSGSLVVVIGPSGAGESTLLRAITGSRPATSGRVVYRGIELYENFASLRQRIGVVPQDDVVHRRLTVRRALRYAAQLRLPADYDAQVREHEVDRVIGDLGPTENADTLISRISGGQRKCVSVAFEPLTRPEPLLLDEPTSGLDPGMDKSVMELLRTQTDGGRAVLVVTRSTDNLDLCDEVLILAPGGRAAYLGPPRRGARLLRRRALRGGLPVAVGHPGPARRALPPTPPGRARSASPRRPTSAGPRRSGAADAGHPARVGAEAGARLIISTRIGAGGRGRRGWPR